MKNKYKIPALKIPFLPLMFTFFVLCTFFICFFFKAFGWSGWPGLALLMLLWLLSAYPIIRYFQTLNEGLIINKAGLFLTINGQKVELTWEEISKIGFQAMITPESFGIKETRPYLAVDLRDNSKITVLKSSHEFGFLQKKNDLISFMDQKDILDLYISMRFASEKDSDLLAFLSSKISFVEKLNNLNKKQQI